MIAQRRIRSRLIHWCLPGAGLSVLAACYLLDLWALVFLPVGRVQRVLLGLTAVLVVLVPAIILTLRQRRRATNRSQRMFRLMSSIAKSRRDITGQYDHERHRLRRDLHDSLGPVLATAVLRIDSARRLVGTDSAAVDNVLLELREDTFTVLSEIRRLIYELGPATVEPRGLRDALESLVERFTKASDGKLAVTLTIAGNLSGLPAEVGLAVYRIVSEALTNVARHARATRCVVTVSVTERVVLEVVDDGIGIRDRGGGGLGLGSIQERARELGGRGRIERRRPHGTRVLVDIPLNETPLHTIEEARRGSDIVREEGVAGPDR
jgi:signal transduction histidine kinase